jgi:hypothetical protein
MLYKIAVGGDLDHGGLTGRRRGAGDPHIAAALLTGGISCDPVRIGDSRRDER